MAESACLYHLLDLFEKTSAFAKQASVQDHCGRQLCYAMQFVSHTLGIAAVEAALAMGYSLWLS